MSDKAFEIRAYGKSELAMIYHPKCSRRAALARMRNWYETNPRLRYLLDVPGYDFTPKQVQQIVDELGEP